MADLSVNRTLVKSPPELWVQLSEVESLARHLGEFGEIAITRLEPEHTVAWEGENARGTVELEASGWGTKVTLSAALHEPTRANEPDEPDDGVEELVAPVGRPSWLRRLFRRSVPEPVIGEQEAATLALDSYLPQPPAWYEPDASDFRSDAEQDASPAVGPERAEAAFEAALDTLGAAHHRPFSRG
ncbi:MAG: hypothetical protein ACR2HC_04490 [Thermoleophilaceae bacterium]